MDKDNPTAASGQDGKFLSGFLLGLLVGGFVVFLLGTKKGKKLLKAISKDGIDNISNILDETSKTEDLDEVAKPSFAKATEGRRREFAYVEKPKVRRFFRGISRRVN